MVTKVGYLHAQLAHLISLNYPIFYAQGCYTPVKFLNKAQPLHHYGMLAYFLETWILVFGTNKVTMAGLTTPSFILKHIVNHLPYYQKYI